MKKLLTVLIFAILLAPAPWGIAINTQTQQCTGYWAGDEYFTYTLPDGWQAYYPGAGDIIHTPVGNCSWDRQNWKERAEKCCVELGYSYTGEELGEARLGGLTILMLSGLCLAGVVLCAGGAVVLGLAVWLYRRLSRR